jgi:beta-galactosidase
MLVIDEAFDMWNVGKTPYDYHLYFKEWWQKDIESMVYRDRNHPSIILWSIGNEIPEHEKELGFETAKMISAFVKNLDSTRPTLSGVDKLYSENNKDPFFSAIDVGGYNYAINADTMETNAYETDHQRVPKRIMIGTESYPLEAFGSWMAVLDHPYVLGDFVWTAWDYIGEASIGWLGYPQKQSFYPWNLAFCGDIDICGWKRPQSYYRDALWKTNQISIFVKPPEPSFKHNPDIGTWAKWNWHDVLPEWNWEGFENKRMEVSVYSSCEKVELFLNGHTLGVKPTNRSTKFIATYAIPYQAGELKAVGYSDNKIVNSSSINTAFQPSQIRLSADRRILKANNKDLSYITVELIDKNGNINPKGEHLINFSVLGDGEIIGVGNANPMSLESYQKSFRKTWKGRCIVIVKAGKTPGKIILKASGEQLKPVDISLSVEN